MHKSSGVVILLLLFSIQAVAQRVVGKVVDKTTGLPVVNATVKTRIFVTFTSAAGGFMLSGLHPGDTINIAIPGYNSFRTTLIQSNMGDSLRVRLQSLTILLNSVTIKAKRDYYVDSLRNRKDFADVFNYKAPGVIDAFIKKGNTARTINTYTTATNSTTDLVGVNLLSIIDLLKKDKNPQTHLQKILIKDEEEDYVDRLFSKQRVAEITALKADSLADFMTAYRPATQQAKKMNSYDIAEYIKKSYTSFLKNYHPENFSFKNNN